MLLQDAHADGGIDAGQFAGQVGGNVAGHIQQGVGHVLLALVHHVFDVQAGGGQDAGDGRDRTRRVLVDHADAAAADAWLADIRQVDAVGYVAVFQVVAQFGGGHHGAVRLAFRRAGTQMRRAADTLDAQQLLGGEVAEILRDLAAVQCVEQCGVVHQLTAGKVQHAHAVLAHRQRLGVDGVAGRRQVGDMDGQVVAAGQHIAQRDTVLHTAGF